MSCRSDDEDDAALPPPAFSTLTKTIRNDGAAHAEPDAGGMETESEADVEKQFDESTGKKRKYHPFLEYTEVKRLSIGEDSILEPAQINHELYTLMKKFMQDGRLIQVPGHPEKKTDIGLWKQQHAENFNSRTDEWIRVMKYPLSYCCKCPARNRIIAGKDYKRLEFFGLHEETSHATDHSKKLKYDQIVIIHDSVMVAPKQSATQLRRNLMQEKGSQE